MNNAINMIMIINVIFYEIDAEFPIMRGNSGSYAMRGSRLMSTLS